MRISQASSHPVITDNPYTMVRGIRVDLPSILELQHECREGACQVEHCCCSTYEVCITDRERHRIDGCLPFAAHFCSHLRAKDGFDNIFEDLGGRLHCIDTTEEGLCLLAYIKKGSVRCSLHSAAEKIGLHPHEAKPLACVLWPLTISSDRPPLLSVDPNAYSFGCCTHRQGSSGMSPSIAHTLQVVFGPLFMRDLERAMNKVVETPKNT